MKTIRVRHDLDHTQKALLTKLGWEYIVDPKADSCIRFKDHGATLEPPGCRQCRALDREMERQAQ